MLFITTGDCYQNTSGNIRNASLITGLLQYGIDVSIIFISSGKKPDEELKKQLQNVNTIYILGKNEVNNSIWLTKENQKSIKQKVKARIKRTIINIYRRFSVYDPYKSRIRFLNRARLHFDSIDLVISSSDPRSSHLLAYKVMQDYNIKSPWIQYWGDPMSIDVSSKSIMKRALIKNERKLLNKADRVIYTNPITVEYMKIRYMKYAEKIDWIPTPYSFAGESNIKVNNIRNIGYFGDYIHVWRNIIPLCEAVIELKMKLNICGDGDINLPDNENIEKHNRLPLVELKAFEQESDILIVLENKPKYDKKGNNICTQVPGKLYHYAMSGKYVLVICETEIIEKYYAHYNRFVFCKNDIESICYAIEKIIDGKYNGLNRFVEAFTPINVTSTLLSNIDLKGNS